MFHKIQDFFQTNATALDILAYRQEILSSNIANADTPNYQAKDINFNNELKKAINNNQNHIGKLELAITSKQHITQSSNSNVFNVTKNNKNQYYENTLHNNSVNMDQERIKFIENAIKYQTYLTLLNNQIKNMYNVIQG